MNHEICMYLKTVGLAGLIRAAIAKFRGQRTFLEMEVADAIHPIAIRVPSTDAATFKKVFVDQEYNLPVEFEPKTIIDAEANVGLASIYFANRFPHAQILAIEPESSNFEVLKKNVAPYSNIIALHVALWDKTERIRLVDPGIGNWGFRTESGTSSESVGEESMVQAVTVSDLIREYKLERISILKVDIEGSEKEVFSHSSDWKPLA